MSPHYSWLGRALRLIPGARGFLEREKLREADIAIRRYAAQLLDEAVRDVEAARSQAAIAMGRQWLAAAAMLPGMPGMGGPAQPGLSETLAGLSRRLRELATSILYADSGWAPVSAARKIGSEEIRRLCSYDDTMIGLAEAARELAKRIRAAVERGDTGEAQRLAAEMGEALDKLQALYEERRRYISFATAQGPGVAERVKAALGSALEAARETLGRLAGRLGLRP